jgi:hypothetical protein
LSIYYLLELSCNKIQIQYPFFFLFVADKARKRAGDVQASVAQVTDEDKSQQQPVFHLSRCYLKMAPTLEEVNRVLDATINEGVRLER